MRILLLLIPFASFAQTGKVKQTPEVGIRFQTIAGITTVVIKNHALIQSEVEYKYNGLYYTVNLPWGGEYKFTTLDSKFFIMARNGGNWIEADSEIRACEIKAIKSARLLTKFECNEIRLTTPSPIVLH